MPIRKKRRRKKAPIAGLAPGVEFHEVETSNVIVLSGSLEGVLRTIGTFDCAGAFVKVQPTIPASKRDTWDPETVRASLLEQGARYVGVSPDFVPDTHRVDEADGNGLTGREAVELWFSMQNGDAKVLDVAKAVVLREAEAEGL